eukprot:COSAG02_NODE_14350_length_1281_cov_4.043993_1_plen_98_part_00
MLHIDSDRLTAESESVEFQFRRAELLHISKRNRAGHSGPTRFISVFPQSSASGAINDAQQMMANGAGVWWGGILRADRIIDLMRPQTSGGGVHVRSV